MLRAFLTAFRTLTILPIGGGDTSNLSLAVPFFPFVGAFLGALVLGFKKAGSLVHFGDPWLLTLLSLAFVTWLTGCLHVDGLGDAADAFGGGRTKERVLHILKDSRMGSFGVCAIIFDLLIKASCWHFSLARDRLEIVFWSLVFARSVQGLMIAFFPNPREESIAAPFGQGRKIVRDLTLVSFLMTGLIAAFTITPFGAFVYGGCAVFVSGLFGLYCRRRIGGITGDCVGAASELAEVGVLLGGILLAG